MVAIIRFLCAITLSLLVITGCATTRKATDAHKVRTGGDWGYFNGPVDTRWNPDGRTMTVLTELRYTDPNGTVWTAPAGSVIDGASIPRALWTFMGGPFEGKYRNASVLHDVAYDQKNRPPAECDRMFYNAMRCSGVGAVEAKTMYYSLLRFGWHWKFKARRAKAVATGSAREESRPTAVTPGDVNAIEQWIEQSNPSLDQIESRAEDRR